MLKANCLQKGNYSLLLFDSNYMSVGIHLDCTLADVERSVIDNNNVEGGNRWEMATY